MCDRMASKRETGSLTDWLIKAAGCMWLTLAVILASRYTDWPEYWLAQVPLVIDLSDLINFSATAISFFNAGNPEVERFLFFHFMPPVSSQLRSCAHSNCLTYSCLFDLRACASTFGLEIISTAGFPWNRLLCGNSRALGFRVVATSTVLLIQPVLQIWIRWSFVIYDEGRIFFLMQLRAPSNYIFSRSKLWFTATARSRNKLEQFHNQLEEINSIPQAVSLEQPNSCPYDEVCLFYIQRYHIYNTAHIILSSGNWHSSDIPHLPRYSWR